MKKVICLCCAVFLLSLNIVVYAEPANLELSAKSVILMEQSTKEVLYENNPDEHLAIASVTKIMTMLLLCSKELFYIRKLILMENKDQIFMGEIIFI